MLCVEGNVFGDALDAVRDPCDADRYPLLEVVQDGAFCDRLAPEHAGHALMRMLPNGRGHSRVAIRTRDIQAAVAQCVL